MAQYIIRTVGWRSDDRRAAIRAPDEAVLVAGSAGSESTLLRVAFPAPVAGGTEKKPYAATRLADARGRRRSALDVQFELAGLVKLSDLLCATDVTAADEDAREAKLSPTEEALELCEKSGIHRQIPLVDGHTVATKDGSHHAAVLEGLSHNTETRVVDHDPLVLRLGHRQRR
ncbi:hypothetical protein IEQ34_012684 [Dendrobium chrysotoxum]|uniref:Uncharacterized protein n=1 Tax=Dendrobium chrysotoxum TaxID=161865 RepID=A0AAV7GPG0_DENCH|nr:hypothetical protein IEQ34_012684 [Dendrobium chrysotoxum]